MKLLLDQGLPRSAVKLLCEVGIDAVHVGEIGYSTADDATILQTARGQGRIPVTLDADFHALLALSRATFPSVIRIRIEGLHGQRAAKLIQAVLKDCTEDLEKGAMMCVAREDTSSWLATAALIIELDEITTIFFHNQSLKLTANRTGAFGNVESVGAVVAAYFRGWASD